MKARSIAPGKCWCQVLLDLESEPFAPSGGIDGRAARRAMGKPDMQFWELFLRETLQNSWDAKRVDRYSIGFAVEAVMFETAQSDVLRTKVFADVPPSLESFQERLSMQRTHALVISDSHTRGLGGVTRADRAARPGEPRDFVDLVRNVGRASTKELGGGTYGFGKGVLYDASAINTCLIYSQTLADGEIEARFIVSSVAEMFEQNGGRYTGRHWWGAKSADGIVEPLRGEDARQLALSLGILRLLPDETGTTICVLEPVLDEEQTLTPVIEQVADAATKWAWPHMVNVHDGPTIAFRFAAYGTPVETIVLSEHPIYQHYERAYEKAIEASEEKVSSQAWPWTTVAIGSLRPTRHLGALTYRRFVVDEEAVDSDIRRNIALMRNPRFIVKYLPVPDDASGQGTAGVFIVDPPANDDFAKSEPVAHDDWVPSGGRANPVKIALGRIREEFKTRSMDTPVAAGGEHASGVAQVSRVLGSMLSGLAGKGAEVVSTTAKGSGGGGGGGGGRRTGLSVTLSPHTVLREDSGDIFVDFALTINGSSSPSDYLLDVSPKVVLDGGAVEDAKDRPDGAEVPELIGWYSGADLVSAGSQLPAGSVPASGIVARVRQPEGVAVTVVASLKKI